jgi:putative transposase
MRTVKREILSPNTEKRQALQELCEAYTREKRHWLQQLRSWDFQSLLDKPRTIRDQFVSAGYRSRYGLQARHWKLALDDALQTWDKYWQAIFVKVRSRIARRKDLLEPERHYAYWLLKGYAQFALVMQGKAPTPPFSIERQAAKRIASYVHSLTRKCRGASPTAKKGRSVKFDANCYEVFEWKGRQYIKLMSLKPGKRIALPLLGQASITGTIALVLSTEGTHIHVSQDLKKKGRPKGGVEAVDFGYTEVMTDTAGIRYGANFGRQLTGASEQRHEKMQKRHKLHSIHTKASPKDAENIRKYNLGRKKQFKEAKRIRATLEREINTAINELIRTKAPSLLITEDLHHAFTYDKPKSVNRRLSSWVRGTLQDRIEFKALAEGFRHEQVNCAYGSQSCPFCDFVDHRNREKDRFQCLNCGHENTSDRVAALNYARRYGDPEIGRYTPYRKVKTILLSRFHRRLEAGQPATVPGRTLDIEREDASTVLSHSSAGRGDSTYRAITQRAKQKINTF